MDKVLQFLKREGSFISGCIAAILAMYCWVIGDLNSCIFIIMCSGGTRIFWRN